MLSELTFFVLNSNMDIQLQNGEKIKLFLALKFSDAIFILLINVGILTFISRISFMLS